MAKKKVQSDDDGNMELYQAVARYVERHGGKVVVAGGIQLQQAYGPNNAFYVAVKCTGRKPIFEGKERP